MAIIQTVIQGGGTTPTGTLQITTNGTHDVTNYATADVQVPTTAPAHYIEKSVDAGGVLKSGTTFIDLTGATSLDEYQLAYAYYSGILQGVDIDFKDISLIRGNSCYYTFVNARGINNVKMGKVTTIWSNGCYYMFQSSSYGSTGITGSVDLGSLVQVQNNGCGYMFSQRVGITSLDIHSLESVGSYGCYCMFDTNWDDTTLTGALDLSKLTTIGSNGCQYMFRGRKGIVSVNLSGLQNITISSACNGMFQRTGITQFDLSNLSSITASNACQYMFANAAIQTGVFPSLNTVSGSLACANMFDSNTTLTSLSFYALTPSSFGSSTNQFNNMLYGVTGCTVHFPMAIQSTIGSWASVTGGFGGTNTTVLFDIVTTLTGADTNSYIRKQKESTSTATAWIYNDTLYYTSGTTEPAVNDTIYSDSACTTAVTTISAIA